jgi:hypothetical protein
MRKTVGLILGSLLFVTYIVTKYSGGTSTLSVFVIEYAIFGFIGILIFSIYHARLIKNTLSSIDILSTSQIRIFDAMYIFFLSLSILSLRDAIYVKPLSYYVFISAAFVAIGLQILFTKRITKVIRTKILVEILILAALTRVSTPLINPYLTGWDAYWHYHRIGDLVTSGKLNPASGHYYYYPFFHIINTITSLFLSFDIPILLATNLLIGTFTVLLMYYIVNELSNSKIALIGALITAVSTLHIYRSTGLARPEVTFILFGILAIIKASRYGIYRSWIIFWLAAVAVFFVHPTATVALLAFLGANFVLKNTAAYFKEKHYTFKITPFVSYFIGFVAYLEFVHYSLFVEIVKIIFIPDEEVVPLITVLPPETVAKMSWIYHFEAYISYIGISLILLLGVIGSLKWLLKYDLEKLTILLGIVFIYIIPVYSVLTNFFETQPSRFLVHGDILTIIPAAVGLTAIFALIKKNYLKILVAASFLFIFCFFSLTSYLTGDDNGIFNRELPFDQRHATQPVLAEYPFVNKIVGSIYVDEVSSRYLFSGDRGIIQTNKKDIRMFSPGVADEKGFFIINLDKLDRGFIWKVKIDKAILNNFKETSKIYDNGEVVIFRR